MNKHHTINYIEFPSTDLAATQAFYGKVFGWEFQVWGDTYVSFNGAGIDGGFDSTSEKKPSREGSLVILLSENLEASEAAVKDAGGMIVKEIFSFPGGSRFHFLDPSGNELAIWSKEN